MASCIRSRAPAWSSRSNATESIYWVISRDCNQRCRHCYNNSEPGAEGLSLGEVDQIVPSLLPAGRIILSGGEVLHVPELLFHTLGKLREHFGAKTQLWIQTNGDLLDEPMLVRLLDAGVVHIGVSSIDDFHPRETLDRRAFLEDLFRRHRVPDYAFWGATPEMWIGKIWPRGRALGTGHPGHARVSIAGPDDDFCNRWSGALGFLDSGAGSEVNIQLAAVYPCCPMTVRPIGDLRAESLQSILDRCRTNPVYQALNRGNPAAMGVHLGISEEAARERIEALGNECLWCDEFFLTHYRNPDEPTPQMPGGRRDLVAISRLTGLALPG